MADDEMRLRIKLSPGIVAERKLYQALSEQGVRLLDITEINTGANGSSSSTRRGSRP